MNYTFVDADSLSVSLFSVFCVFMTAMVLFAVHRSGSSVKNFSYIFFGFLLSFSGLVLSHSPLMRVIPTVPGLFFSVLLFSSMVAFSEYGKKISTSFSLAALIGFQGFRLPLELILHHWADLGTIPETMTWTGQNLDIITGIISLLAVPLLSRSRALAWAVQIIGFLLLMNVLRVVVMSSPLPFSWPLEKPLMLIGYMPYALIGPLFVGVALGLHFITFRALLKR